MISIEHVCKTYGKKDASVEALKDITLNIPDSGMTAIMGPSGSGKSTLLNMIGCLDSPSSGSIKIDGKDISQVSVKEKAKLRNKFFAIIIKAGKTNVKIINIFSKIKLGICKKLKNFIR